MSHELISKLERLKRGGKIKQYGIATGNRASAKILHHNPDFKGVVQSEYGQNMDDWLTQNKVLFVHSLFNNAQFHALLNSISNDRESTESIVNALADLGIACDIKQLPALLALHQCLTTYAPEKIIFSSSKLDHIEQVVAAQANIEDHKNIHHLTNRLPFQNVY